LPFGKRNIIGTHQQRDLKPLGYANARTEIYAELLRMAWDNRDGSNA
jgi:hypothetical protein